MRTAILMSLVAAVCRGSEPDGGMVDESLRVDLAATTGARVVHTSPNGTVPEQLEFGAMLHGLAEVTRESGAFRVVGRASLLAYTASDQLPSLRDLGSFVDVSLGVADDVRVGVRLMPFSRNVFRMTYDFANDFERLGSLTLFSPVLVFTTSGSWWHASLGGGFQPGSRAGGVIAAERPRFIASFGTSLESVEADLRVGVVTQEPTPTPRGVVPGAARTLTALRVGWRYGVVGRPVDFSLYDDDPDRFANQFTPRPEPGHAFESELELGAAESWFPHMPSLPLYAQLRLGALLSLQRLFIVLRVRTPSQLLWSDSNFFSGTFDATEPAFTAFFGVDRRLGPLTLGLATRVGRPAVLRAFTFDFGGANPPPNFMPFEFWVSDIDRAIQLAPLGHRPPVRVEWKVTARLELGAHVCVVGEFDADTLSNAPEFAGISTARRPVTTITTHVFAQLH